MQEEDEGEDAESQHCARSDEHWAERLVVAVLAHEPEYIGMAEVRSSIGRSCVEEMAAYRLGALMEGARGAQGLVSVARLLDAWDLGALAW